MTTETTVEALQGYASAQALNVPEQFIEALRASQAITAANEALAQAPHASLGVAALPADFNLHDLEPYLPLRRRARGTFATQFVAPFAQYTHAHAGDGASVFVNAQEMSATAVLDLGTPHAPGHGDNKTRLQLQRTAAFQALMAIADKGQRQAQVAEFLEDWAPHATLQLFDADNKEVPLRQAVAAVRRVTIETARKVESDVQQLSASLSAFESVKASSKEPLPTTIYFSCQPYADLQPRLFVLRLSVTSDDKAPILKLRIQNMERHTEEMGQELVTLAQDAMRGNAAIPVLLGSYSKGQ